MKRHPLNVAMGEEVHAQRLWRGWALDDLHAATGIAKSHLCDLERGAHTFSIDIILALETVFKMVVNGLLTLARRRLRRKPPGRNPTGS